MKYRNVSFKISILALDKWRWTNLPRRASDLTLVGQFLGTHDQAAAYGKSEIDALLARENDSQRPKSLQKARRIVRCVSKLCGAGVHPQSPSPRRLGGGFPAALRTRTPASPSAIATIARRSWCAARSARSQPPRGTPDVELPKRTSNDRHERRRVWVAEATGPPCPLAPTPVSPRKLTQRPRRILPLGS